MHDDEFFSGPRPIIYQATNWIYCGTSKPWKDCFPDGYNDHRSVPKELQKDPTQKWVERNTKHKYVWFANKADECLLAWVTKPYPKIVQELGTHGGDRRSKDFSRCEKHILVKGTGNRDYTLARLKRDYPKIAQALERKKFKSVRAAAIAAGFIKG
jgi:hypothetical protein